MLPLLLQSQLPTEELIVDRLLGGGGADCQKLHCHHNSHDCIVLSSILSICWESPVSFLLQMVIMVPVSMSSFLRRISGANFQPIVAWKAHATSGSLNFSRSNLSLCWVGVLAFYAPPQKVAGYYVIPSELLSVCPSVCPSVRPSAVEHSCPVHNFETVWDNFTKLGTNVKHDQTTCRD